MIQSIADFLDIPEPEFAQHGCFNGFVNQDAPLFLSPYLLKQYRQGEFEHAYQSVISHITAILQLLKNSNGDDDCWREAFSTLKYQEVREIGLGYSRLGTHGREPSKNVRNRFLTGLRKLIRMDIDNPDDVAAITIFEDHLGPDQLSDLLASIIKRHLARYTQTTLLLMGIDRGRLRRWRLRRETVFLPEHPSCKGKPILLVPTAILSSLPRVSTARQLPALFPPYSKERADLRALIAGIARRIQKADRTAEIGAQLAAKPDLFREIRKLFGAQMSSAYDLVKDPEGVVSWYADTKQMLVVPRTATNQRQVSTNQDMHMFIDELLVYLKDLFEKKGYWRNLYRSRQETGQPPSPLRETSINWILSMLLERECNAAGVDLSVTPSFGNGEPDFKLSVGSIKSIIEVKRLSHKKLPSAADQIRQYAESGSFSRAIILVVNNGGNLSRFDALHARLQREEFKDLNIELEYINASLRASPAAETVKSRK